MTDRERILVNIAAALAHELSHLQGLPETQRYMANPHSMSSVRCAWGYWNKEPFVKGDLVACFTSYARQQNPHLVAFVEGPHPTDQTGLALRAIGTNNVCNYGNESFIRISGIPERLLWEGDKHQFAAKLGKAFAKLDDYFHRFRGIKFNAEGMASVFVGPVFGGTLLPPGKTKPYEMQIKFGKRTSVKNIIVQMKEQGYGTREFEPDDGAYAGPMQGLTSINREDVVGAIEAAGIELKPEFSNGAK